MFVIVQLRGVSSKMVTTDVYKMIDAVHLEEKTSTESRHLSGGQKRKLSVGIALVAGAQVTMDIYSPRSWSTGNHGYI